MKRLVKQVIIASAGIALFLCLLGYAGSYEYADQIIYNMSDSSYEAVVNKLGGKPSTKAIAAEYLKNKEYYDSIQF